MSQSYTIGGDTLFKCDHPNWAGQTFSVTENQTLAYIDLELRGAPLTGHPVVQIFNRDAWHKPWGPCLSRNRYTTESLASPFHIGRARLSMQPLQLNVGEWYVIIVSNFPSIGAPSLYWQYDAAGATYARGLRISTNDGGVTWTPHHGSDHIFAIISTPPLPEAEPPPPINNFAAIDCTFDHAGTSVTISVSTSVPCHLTSYHTALNPRKHYTTRRIRGITVLWHTAFAFKPWYTVEQLEPGDTMYHTFIVSPWLPGQTKWLAFKGEVDFSGIPSVSPIFKHRHPGSVFTDRILRADARGDLCSIPWQSSHPCPYHYNELDDIVPDEGTTMVWAHDFPFSNVLHDLYYLTFPFDKPQNITRVVAVARCRITNTTHQVSSLQIGIKTHDFIYKSGAITCDEFWRNYSIDWLLNPFTGSPWTWEELMDLQVGIGLNEPRSPRSGNNYTQCTQVFAIYYYSY